MLEGMGRCDALNQSTRGRTLLHATLNLINQSSPIESKSFLNF